VASVRGRLRELARRRGLEFQLILSEFAIERLLYRLGASSHSDRFVVKGATLFRLWAVGERRATWDLDLLGRGPSGVDDVVAVVRDLCELVADDAIEFDAASVRGEEIRSPDEYGGVRVRLVARLAGAEIPVQIDVGFGDAVEPAPRIEPYPTLLGHPAPRVLVYPRETVVAEKLEAIVSLGVTTSRMKDFYDVHHLAASFEFDGEMLLRAIRATFARRGTPLPDEEPLALTRSFLSAPERVRQWSAFLRRSRLEAPAGGAALSDELRRFLLPLIEAARVSGAFTAHWPAGGPWEERRC
jgi:predicted nucleotidyltransferase component of viral defense system